MAAMSKGENDRKDSPQSDDYHYVDLCQRGNTDAFEFLVERYQKKMLNMAFRITGDYDEACETVQEALLSAYRSIKKFRGEAAFSTWLTRITVNHARNRLKKMRSMSRYEGYSIDDQIQTETGLMFHSHASPEVSVIEQLEKKEMQARVQECIASLDNDFREVLVLRDMEEFSYGEIHDILNIPEGTIKSRLFRARDAMRKCLKQVLGDVS
jgi:RNA polymerase sigma-70 factor (ECF subfamily)